MRVRTLKARRFNPAGFDPDLWFHVAMMDGITSEIPP